MVSTINFLKAEVTKRCQWVGLGRIGSDRVFMIPDPTRNPVQHIPQETGLGQISPGRVLDFFFFGR